MTDLERRQRAAERLKRAVVRRARLGDETELEPIRGAPAISLLTRLTLESWSLSRSPLPSYTRAEIPIRFVPGREP